MAENNLVSNGSVQHWVVGRSEPSGEFTAQVVGLPELRASAATRAEAIDRIQGLIGEWLASGKLMTVEVPLPNPLLHFSGHLDPNEPLEQEFVEELARQRRENYECPLQEESQGCSNSSSTPSTGPFSSTNILR